MLAKCRLQASDDSNIKITLLLKGMVSRYAM
jgi:hypothetical protein